MELLGQLGIVIGLGLAAAGSALGMSAAGRAAAGAWAMEARTGKPLRFNYIIFVGAPISQTLYALILMLQLGGLGGIAAEQGGLLLGIGLALGIGEFFSAWGQGLVGAAACRTLAEGEGKGLAFLLIAIGIVETVGIFTLVFLLTQLPQV